MGWFVDIALVIIIIILLEIDSKLSYLVSNTPEIKKKKRGVAE
jgi:hypothetical protein